MQALEYFGGLHGNGDAGSIVDGAGAEVPRIKMPRNDNDLLGMVRTLDIGDNVIPGFVRQLLGSEREVHTNFFPGLRGGR